jgi:hypothetical protein
MSTKQSDKRQRMTARVRRGLSRVLMVANADLTILRTEFREHGMTKARLEDYEMAVAWIRQQKR